METAIICTVFGVFILFAFGYGLKCGQKLKKEEPIELPKMPNPIQTYKEWEAKQEFKKEQSILETQIDNIDSYDGTGNGQKDIPL